MMFKIAFIVAAFCLASSACAQIIFEPVQYQYGQQQSYYYGGSDPRVFASAEATHDGASRWGRVNGWAFASGGIDTHREVATEPTRVFADAIPFRNATFFGYSANDARNEAYANAPTYFRKSDLL